MDFFAHRGWIESRLSRKIIHIGTGPIFVLCWLMFPEVWYVRWLTTLVPFLITTQFALISDGLKILRIKIYLVEIQKISLSSTPR